MSPVPILAVVHPLGGDVFCYRELLAPLKGKVRPFAIRHPDLHRSSQVKARSMRQMAIRYTRSLESALGRSPDYICGWSLGGAIAHEMAAVWEDQACKPRGVIMIDSPLEGSGHIRAAKAFRAASGSASSQATLQQIGDDPEFCRMLEEDYGMAEIFRISTRSERDNIVHVHASGVLALADHAPARILSDILYLLPKHSRNANSPIAATARLSALSSGKIIVEPTGGDHFSMIKGDSALWCAELIGRYIG